jgi:hypothetical protein
MRSLRDGRQRGEAVCQRLEEGAGHERPALHVTRRYATANWRLYEISADHTVAIPAISAASFGNSEPMYPNTGGVEVDQSRCHVESFHVKDLARLVGGRIRGDADDLTARNADITDAVDLIGWIDDVTVLRNRPC